MMIKLLSKISQRKGMPSENELKKQFREIELEGRRQEREAKKQQQFCVAEQHPDKNRYNNILPFEGSRVKLKDNDGFYINASWIKVSDYPRHSYIATQGPLASTRHDFWNMVGAEGLKTVVMLTNTFELGKEKAAKYWPTAKQPIADYGDYIVALTGKERHNGWVVRSLELRNKQTGTTVQVKQFHFKSWPDFGTPDSNWKLFQLIKAVRNWNGDGPPPVVHCSAGVGRSGTYCVIDMGLTAKASKKDINVEIPRLVREMRLCRPGMVQNADQYIMCFKALYDPILDSQTSAKNRSKS